MQRRGRKTGRLGQVYTAVCPPPQSTGRLRHPTVLPHAPLPSPPPCSCGPGNHRCACRSSLFFPKNGVSYFAVFRVWLLQPSSGLSGRTPAASCTSSSLPFPAGPPSTGRAGYLRLLTAVTLRRKLLETPACKVCVALGPWQAALLVSKAAAPFCVPTRITRGSAAALCPCER